MYVPRQFYSQLAIPPLAVSTDLVFAQLTNGQHPDLFIQFLGWFEDPARDTIHIAMEYIQHGDLGQYIAMGQSKADPREITSQILEGLVVLHEREICHRDLKPQVRYQSARQSQKR